MTSHNLKYKILQQNITTANTNFQQMGCQNPKWEVIIWAVKCFFLHNTERILKYFSIFQNCFLFLNSRHFHSTISDQNWLYFQKMNLNFLTPDTFSFFYSWHFQQNWKCQWFVQNFLKSLENVSSAPVT